MDPQAQVVLPVVTYSYLNGDAGLLASATYGMRSTAKANASGVEQETYSYVGGFEVNRVDTASPAATELRLKQVSDLLGVVSEESAGVAGVTAIQWSRSSQSQTTCCPANTCCTAGSAVSYALVHYPGSSLPGPSVETVQTVESEFAVGARTSSWSTDAGTVVWQWDDVGGANASRARQDESGAWEVATYATPADAGAVPTRELRQVVRGASAADGTGALESTNYSYAYGGVGRSPRAFEPLVKTEDHPSVVNAGQNAITTYNYDTSTNQLRSVIKQGWSGAFDSSGAWSTVARFVGTFYFTDSDPLGRATRIHGPCFVTDVSATDCVSGAAWPITDYVYFPANATAPNDSNRLNTVSRYSSMASGNKQVTTYSAYDAFGNPKVVWFGPTDGQTFVYQENHVIQRTDMGGGGPTWHYLYDLGQLHAIQSPSGLYEVFCHRSGTSVTPCPMSGPPTKELMSKMLATSSDGTGFSEAVVYQYGSDGSVTGESYLDATGTIRRRVSKRNDPFGHAISSQDGESGPKQLTRFDGVGNLRALRMPFTDGQEPTSCDLDSSGAVIDPRCAALSYDRASRLTQLDEAGLQGGARTARTTLGYDLQGNVNTVQTGCPVGSTCTTPTAQYQWDDFGNVISAEVPGFDATGTRSSPIRYEYDALGNLVKKQTAAMRGSLTNKYLAWEFDGLGRQVAERSVAVGTGAYNLTLYTKQWDVRMSLPAGCPTPTGGSTMGRLASESDPVWNTWYGYGSEGRLLSELRVRPGQTCNTAGDSWVTTNYTYNADGHVLSEQHPHGRTVFYSYGSGALASRVVAVNVGVFGGPAGGKQFIKDVAWEPYGGLRSYTVQNPDNTVYGRKVEYFPSTDVTSPVTCASGVSLGSGPSSRLRAIYVTTVAPTPYYATYKRFYGWSGDNVASIDTCVLPRVPVPAYCENENDPEMMVCFPADPGTISQHEDFRYDARGQLVAATMPNANGAYVTRGYTYDLRGNRTRLGMMPDGGGYVETYLADAGVVDLLAARQRTEPGSTVNYSYSYTADGQLARKLYPPNASGFRAAIAFDFGESADGGTPTGLESVYRAVAVQSAPSSTVYYNYAYDSARRRTQKSTPAGGNFEFFWGNGHDLVHERAPLNSSGVCVWWDYELDECGYWDNTPRGTMTDYVWLGGKPVFAISGNYNYATRAYESENGQGGHFIVTDHLMRPVLTLNASMLISGIGEYEPFGSANTWEGDSATAVEGVEMATKTPASDFAALSVQYSRYQMGATAWFPPFRFAGQYWDEETGFHENWNRYYDPKGRYLSPEPMLQSPEFVRSSALGGTAVATYVYTANNPLSKIDPSGLFVKKGECALWDRAIEYARRMAGCDRQNQCNPQNECQQKIAECTGKNAGGAGCDICSILVDGQGPPIYFLDGPLTGPDGTPNPSGTGATWLTEYQSAGSTRWAADKVEVLNRMCAATGLMTNLATILLHEASHVCSEQAGVHIGDTGSCSAYAIQEACR